MYGGLNNYDDSKSYQQRIFSGIDLSYRYYYMGAVVA
jgi:hypothetical protein